MPSTSTQPLWISAIWLSVRGRPAARARAFIHGRDYAIPEDIFALAEDVILHRMRLSYEALAQGRTSAGVLRDLLSTMA